MGSDADELVSPHTPRDFYAIGQFYVDFAQTDDAEVVACLAEAGDRAAGSGRTRSGPAVDGEREAHGAAGDDAGDKGGKADREVYIQIGGTSCAGG